jgi:hypothetical protein
MEQLSIFDLQIVGNEVTRDKYKNQTITPYTFFIICIVEEMFGGTSYKPIWNKGGFALEFIDREHAKHFIKEYPQAIGKHDYEIRPITYTLEQIDDNQQEYGKSHNVWDGLERG